jgi:hypothetical protein
VVGLIKSYGLNSCVGDHYSAGFVVAAFARHGVTYRHSERDRSKIYQDVLPIFTSGRARLLDTEKNRLAVQFAGLQRETTSMGRDKIDHQKGGKDDLCNSASLSMVLASSAPKKMTFGGLAAALDGLSTPTYHAGNSSFAGGVVSRVSAPHLARGPEHAASFVPHLPTFKR